MALILAYHGCSKAAAQAVLGGEVFLQSNRPYDWLGSGSYFWEADLLRAYEWAKYWRPESPSIVGAAIELGNCLDLTTRTGIEAVQKAYESYVGLQRQTQNPVPENKSTPNSNAADRVLRYLDSAVIDHLHAGVRILSERSGGVIREFDTVRALFPEGRPLYPGAGFLENTHIQIAVRSPRQIRGVFRVPAAELAELGITGVYDL